MKFKFKLGYIVCLLILLMPLTYADLEKPNWSVGDYWTYSGNFKYSEKMEFENISFSLQVETDKLDVKLKVVGIEAKEIGNELKGCYVAEINSNISGNLVVEGTLFGEKSQRIEGVFNIKTDGKIYFTTDELAVAGNEMDIYIDINVTPNIPLYGIIPSSPLHVVTEYSPPVDFMDFPVKEGEKWVATTNATVYGIETEEGPVTQEMSFSFKCVKKLGDNVYQIESTYNPFGGITPFENISSATTLIWNGGKGMIERVMNMEEGVNLQLMLNDYKHVEKENKPPIAKIRYSPENPKVGTKILFESLSKDEDGEIVYYFWDFGDGKNSTQQNPTHIYTEEGEYTVTLIVMDNYGEESKYTTTIVVGESGGDTPGFGFLSIIALFIITAIWKRFR